MNVSLTPELEQFVQKKVQSGLYQTSSEVVREALRLLSERDQEVEAKRARLVAEIDKGIASLDRGEGKVMDADAIADIKARGRRRKRSI